MFDKYGVEPVRDDKTGGIMGVPPDWSKISEHPGSRTKQLKKLLFAGTDVNTAIDANALAQKELDFKKSQYEAFRKRAEVLSKKAKLDMPGSLSKEAMDERLTVWGDEYLKGGKR